MLQKYFPDREFKALLFDFDGTVADTMGAHWRAWNQGLAVYNLTLSREQHQAWAGRPTRMIIQMLNEMHKIDIPADQFLQDKEKLYFASLHEVKEIVSVMEIVRHYQRQLPMAIVTGSRRKVVERTLQHLNLADCFDTLVCAEDYQQGKPAPDCFLTAASRLKVMPEECLVFEDAELGVEAARKAGMACLRLDQKHQLMLV